MSIEDRSMADAIKQVSLSQITERQNYRQEYDQQFVQGIASDIAANGYKVEFPLIVYADGDQYVLIDGHTRHNAALLASTYRLKDHKPLMLVWVAVKDKPTDSQFKLQQIAANEQRRDPDDISKAIGYKQALDAGATLTDIASATGRTIDYIQRRVALLGLLPEVQELVSKSQIGITFAYAMRDLDSNRQRLALRAYNAMKSPTFDEFNALVSQLLEQQNKCSLFDLALFNGQPIEQVLNELKIERKKTRAEIEAELEQTSKALEKERSVHAENKRRAIATFTAMQKELIVLRAQLAAQKAA